MRGGMSWDNVYPAVPVDISLSQILRTRSWPASRFHHHRRHRGLFYCSHLYLHRFLPQLKALELFLYPLTSRIIPPPPHRHHRRHHSPSSDTEFPLALIHPALFPSMVSATITTSPPPLAPAELSYPATRTPAPPPPPKKSGSSDYKMELVLILVQIIGSAQMHSSTHGLLDLVRSGSTIARIHPHPFLQRL